MTPEQAKYAKALAAWTQPGREGYDQNEWVFVDGLYDDEEGQLVEEIPIERMREGTCGTHACLAGRVAIDRAPAGTVVRDITTLVFPDGGQMEMPDFAMEQLGLTFDQTTAVFWASAPYASQRLAYIADHPQVDSGELHRLFGPDAED